MLQPDARSLAAVGSRRGAPARVKQNVSRNSYAAIPGAGGQSWTKILLR